MVGVVDAEFCVVEERVFEELDEAENVFVELKLLAAEVEEELAALVCNELDIVEVGEVPLLPKSRIVRLTAIPTSRIATTMSTAVTLDIAALV